MKDRALPWLCLCAFSSMASMRICDSMLPAIASDLATSLGEAAVAISVFALAYGFMQMVYGPLGDRFGKLRVICAATLLCTVGSVVSMASLDVNWLVWSRALSGAAAAGVIPLAMAWIGDNVPYETRQAVLARLLGATVFGMISGQWLGGVIAEALGWRMAFASLAALFFVSGITLSVLYRSSRISPESPSVSVLEGVRSVLRPVWARYVLLVVFFEGALVFGVLVFIPSYLNARFGLTMSEAGAVVALYGIGGLVYSRLAKKALAHAGEKGLVSFGSATLALSFVALGLSDEMLVAPLACLLAGFGFYALHNTLQTNATQMAPLARGTAVSMFVCSLFLGQSIGISVISQVMKHRSLSTAFVLCGAGILVLGVVFGLALKQRPGVAST